AASAARARRSARGSGRYGRGAGRSRSCPRGCVPAFHLLCGEVVIVPLGDVAQSRFRGADHTPDGVLGGERPRRSDLPDAHFVSLCPNLKKRVRVDSQASANVDRNGDLALLGDAVDLRVRKDYSTYERAQPLVLPKEPAGCRLEVVYGEGSPQPS